MLAILLYFNLFFQPSGNPVTATSRPPPFYPFPNIPDYFPATTLLPTSSTTTQLPSTSTAAPVTTATTSPLPASTRPPPTTFYPDPVLPLRPVGEESSSAVDLSNNSTTTATTTTSTTTTSTTTTSTTASGTTSFPLSGKVEALSPCILCVGYLNLFQNCKLGCLNFTCFA